jgi:hypothetical protein
LITQIDAVAFNANPVQCFFHVQLIPVGASDGPAFYYDSQSTGEGNGVWFSWRGALPVLFEEQVFFEATSSATIDWGCIASGLILPMA